MSKQWAKGSSRAWRRTRVLVLIRDGHRCQLTLPGCTTRATQVHHVAGRANTGDDIRWLQAACQPCNATVGDPGRGDPAPQPRTRW